MKSDRKAIYNAAKYFFLFQLLQKYEAIISEISKFIVIGKI